MNSINLALDIPEDVSLNILSFLNAQELIEVALTCKKLKTWADDFHLWQAKSEAEFTGLVANGAKQPDKSWKQTYFELKKSKEERIHNLGSLQAISTNKMQYDSITYRMELAIAARIGWPQPNPEVHLYPTGKSGRLGNRKVRVMEKY